MVVVFSNISGLTVPEGSGTNILVVIGHNALNYGDSVQGIRLTGWVEGYGIVSGYTNVDAGYNFRGVDFAAYSGYLAAQAVEKAHAAGGMTEKNLSVYKDMLEDSFVMRQLRKFKKAPEIRENRRLFREYPELINDVARQLFHSKYEIPKILEAFKTAKKGRVGWLTLISDLYGVSRRV